MKIILRLLNIDITDKNYSMVILYQEFIKNPLDYIKNSYAHLGFDMTTKTENDIQEYISQDRNKSMSSHNYSLGEFGLTEKKVKDQFRDYMLNYDF